MPPIKRRGRQDGARWIVLGMLAVSAANVHGAEWSVDPTFKSRGLYNTNRRLTTASHEGVFGLVTDVGAEFKLATEASDIAISPMGTINRYSGNQQLDSDDIHLSLDANHRLERAAFGMKTSYDRESTLTSEVNDTGLVHIQREVNLVGVNPSLTYLFDDQNSVRFDYGYSNVAYDNAAGTGLFDYTYQNIGATYTHQLSEVQQVFGALTYANFDVSGLQSTTDSYYARVGYYREFDGKLRLTVSGGGVLSDSTFPVLSIVGNRLATLNQDAISKGWIADFTVEKDFEKTFFRAKYSRSVNPSARGAQAQADEVKISLRHRITEVFDTTATFRYLQSQTQQTSGFGGTSLNRDYINAGLAFAYRINRFWSLIGGYSYTYQKYQSTSAGADSNAVTIGLSYSGEKLAISR